MRLLLRAERTEYASVILNLGLCNAFARQQLDVGLVVIIKGALQEQVLVR